jgi:hypothetical protein
MKAIYRGLVAGVALAGASVGLAGPASAEPLNGTYTATPVADPNGMAAIYPSTTYNFTPCGADCTRLDIGTAGGTVVDLHLQGNVWTGTWVSESGISCKESVNADAVSTSRNCDGLLLNHQLTKV